jgi:hypothetical protein
MKTILNYSGISLSTLLIGAIFLFLTGCDSVTSGEEASPNLLESEITSEFDAKGGSGRWVEMVTGGGKNVNETSGATEWISLSVTKDADGNVSGKYEYGNTPPLQGWRYHGSADCLAISPDGTRAVVIGPVTLSQGPDSPDLGTRVGFIVDDNGNGKNLDSARAFFAGSNSCELYLNSTPAQSTSGNYSIKTR